MAASDYDLHLEELFRRATSKLIDEVFDLEAFLDLRDYLKKKSEAVKLEHVISKQTVLCLIGAARLIEDRAERVPEARVHLGLAYEFSYILGIMASGEAYSDRRPGVPRIV